MSEIASQITGLTIVYSTVNSVADQRKHQSYASLAFVRGIHRRPVNSPHKGPVTGKMFPFDDVIMCSKWLVFGIKWKVGVISIIPVQSWNKMTIRWQITVIWMTLPHPHPHPTKWPPRIKRRKAKNRISIYPAISNYHKYAKIISKYMFSWVTNMIKTFRIVF